MELLRALLNLVVYQRYDFTSDIQIPGFINIERRQFTRMVRRYEREIREDVWEDNPDSFHVELRRLFGLELYEEDIEEPWDEPPSKRSKG
ncbi:uncharacterized protein [Polyergus mexicanus]|uniref:uncharacterized protein isoform X2 n=1 Tax=Polyergus mexicanus TaxID=615972 RepID=UPI0038B5FAB9